MSTAVHPGHVADRYLELIHEFPLRPIRSKAAYRQAARIIDRLAEVDEGKLPRDEQDYLDTLSLLVVEYDRAHAIPAEPVDPITLLKHLMGESGMTVTALGDVLGSKSVASEVLHGKRSLSKANIVRLADHFRLDASAFLPAAE